MLVRHASIHRFTLSTQSIQWCRDEAIWPGALSIPTPFVKYLSLPLNLPLLKISNGARCGAKLNVAILLLTPSSAKIYFMSFR
jgi:hypothetical protein